MRTSLVVTLLAGLLVGCSRAPSNVEVFTKTTELIDQYLHTNAVGAEAAMLLLERHMKAWEKAGYRGREDGSIPLDQAYASLCSRLYLVEKALGKQQAADQYFMLLRMNTGAKPTLRILTRGKQGRQSATRSRVLTATSERRSGKHRNDKTQPGSFWQRRDAHFMSCREPLPRRA